MSGYNFKNFDFGPRQRPLTGKTLAVCNMAHMTIPATEHSVMVGMAANEEINRELMEEFPYPTRMMFDETVRLREEYDRVTDIIQKEFDSKGYNSNGWIHDVSFRGTFMTIRREAEQKKIDWIYDHQPVNNSKYATPPSKRNRNHPSQDQSINARRK